MRGMLDRRASGVSALQGVVSRVSNEFNWLERVVHYSNPPTTIARPRIASSGIWVDGAGRFSVNSGNRVQRLGFPLPSPSCSRYLVERNDPDPLGRCVDVIRNVLWSTKSDQKQRAHHTE